MLVPAAIGVTFSTFFQALGHGVYSLFMTLLRQVIVIMPAAWLLSKTSLGVTGVWLSYPIAEIFGFTFAIILFVHLYKKEIKPMPLHHMQ